MKLDPVLNTLPPLADEYQRYVLAFDEPDADKVTAPEPHTIFWLTLGEEGIGEIIALTAVLDPSQPVVEL